MSDVEERDISEPTAPYTPLFDSDGFAAQPDPVTPLAAQPEPIREPVLVLDRELPEPAVIPAHPMVLPGSFQYLKRWVFALAVTGVWTAAAAAGSGFFYWWFHALDKTPVVYSVLIYLIVCTLAGLLVAMVQNRPVVTAVSIGLMSAPLASVSGAAMLYGSYAFGWATP